MKPSEIRELLNVGRPPAPYGQGRLARAISIGDLRRLARQRLPAGVLGYLEGGGEDEVTLGRNRSAFSELDLVPRVLRDVHTVDLSTTVLGTPMSLPFALAPIGSARIFHHEGELAGARAAGRAGVAFSLSSSGTFSIERVAEEATGPLWYQLYVWRDRGLCKELIARARAAGYRALLVTADTTVRSKREREMRAGLTLPTPALTLSTLFDGAMHPAWSWHFLTSEAIRFANLSSLSSPPSAGMAKMARSFDGFTTWEDLEWIAAAWDGPLALKGVLAPDDARRAADLGVGALVVSNHGGRQLDHVPASIEALPRIVEAVGDRVEVLMDGGIRRGTDVVMALALGARACLIGRAQVYGLAAAGEAGVSAAIGILAEEVRIAMALVGSAGIADLGPALVRERLRSRPTDRL
jgi:L-lactate dehydrogenase (cytochrome)